MAQPEILIGDDDEWLFIRYMTFRNAGDQEPEHSHSHFHYTVIFKGRALFKVKGKLVEYSAPAMVAIDGGEMHQITALEPDTHAACIHDVRKLRG